MTDGIKTVKDGAVLEITIDRPKANAIDLKASRRLNQVGKTLGYPAEKKARGSDVAFR